MTDLSIPLSLAALFISVVAIVLHLSMGRKHRNRLNSFIQNTYFSFLTFLQRLPDWMVLYAVILIWAIGLSLFIGLIAFIQWTWF